MRAGPANVAGTAGEEVDPGLLGCRSRPPPLGEPGSAARLKLALRASQEFRHKRESAEPGVQSLRSPSCPRSPSFEDRQQENLPSPNSPLLKRGRRSWQFQERFLCRRDQKRIRRQTGDSASGNPTPPRAQLFRARAEQRRRMPWSCHRLVFLLSASPSNLRRFVRTSTNRESSQSSPPKNGFCTPPGRLPAGPLRQT